MEVHHHAHPSTSSGHRKKWTHYFWEFLMLFLAVFCGFLAEYQLEHTIEHQREKVFMKSMLEDLEKDTAMLTGTERRSQTMVAYIDTTVSILQRMALDDDSRVLLYRSNLRTLLVFAPVFTDRTSSQLKFSGGMRLIRKRKAADSIIQYWNQADIIMKLYEQTEENKSHAREQSYSIFNQKYYTNRGVGAVMVNDPDPPLMRTDEMFLTEYANRLQHIRNRTTNVLLPLISFQRNSAISLMNTIREEYHLE